MPDVSYVHVKWPDGQDDMVPESTAAIRAKCGDFQIVDDTPAPWRRFKPRVPLGTSVRPKRKASSPEPVIEPAPAGAPDEPEEATK